MIKKSLCCICLLFSASLPLAAQDGSGGETGRKPGRLAWLVHTDMPEGVENPVKVMGGGEITEVELDPYLARGPVKIPADGIIRIIRETPGAGSPGKTKHLILAEAKIPESVRQALIILVALPKPSGDLLFKSKVQDLASFKGGDRLFINLSDTNIGVKIGDTPVAVPARQSNIYTAPKLADSTNKQIVYSFYHPDQRKWKLLGATTIVLQPNLREICIFNNGSRLGNIKRHKILFPVKSANP